MTITEKKAHKGKGITSRTYRFNTVLYNVARAYLKLNHTQVARMINISPMTIGYWLRGKSIPSSSTRKRLAQALQIRNPETLIVPISSNSVLSDKELYEQYKKQFDSIFSVQFFNPLQPIIKFLLAMDEFERTLFMNSKFYNKSGVTEICTITQALRTLIETKLNQNTVEN